MERSTPPEVPEYIEELKQRGLSVSFEETEGGKPYPTHQHGEAHVFVTDGSMIVKVGGEEHVLFSGDQLSIPEGAWHSAVMGKNGCKYWQAEDLNWQK